MDEFTITIIVVFFGQLLIRAIVFNELNCFCDIEINSEFTFYFQTLPRYVYLQRPWRR
jgi:hypothetical protein